MTHESAMYEKCSQSIEHSAYLKKLPPLSILLSVTRSLSCHTAITLIAWKVSCHACCKHIQLSLSLLFTVFSCQHYTLVRLTCIQA